MRKVIKFFSSPLVNLIVGVVLLFLLGFVVSYFDYDLDLVSFLCGVLLFVFYDIFAYGFVSILPWTRSKKVDQDLDD